MFGREPSFENVLCLDMKYWWTFDSSSFVCHLFVYLKNTFLLQENNELGRSKCNFMHGIPQKRHSWCAENQNEILPQENNKHGRKKCNLLQGKPQNRHSWAAKKKCFRDLNTLLKHATGIAPVVSLDSHNKSTETSKTCESTQWQNTDEHVYSHQDPTIVPLYMSSWLSECRSTWVHLSICLRRITPNQQFMAECHHSAETGHVSYDNIWIASICFCSYQRIFRKNRISSKLLRAKTDAELDGWEIPSKFLKESIYLSADPSSRLRPRRL